MQWKEHPHRLPGLAPAQLRAALYQQRCGSHVVVHVDLHRGHQRGRDSHSPSQQGTQALAFIASAKTALGFKQAAQQGCSFACEAGSSAKVATFLHPMSKRREQVVPCCELVGTCTSERGTGPPSLLMTCVVWLTTSTKPCFGYGEGSIARTLLT